MMQRPRHSTIFYTLSVLALCFLVLDARAQGNAHWKVFRLDGNYAVGVSLSHRGNVIVKHGDSRAISWLNGYEQGQIQAPEENNYRVYESKTGQLWTLQKNGLHLFFREWTRHDIREIQQELASNQMRLLRQVPLLPAEVNHVFVLLSDMLLDYDATTRRVGLIKRASDTQLGRFIEMQEAPDGGVWVSGTHGMIKFEGPLRHLNEATPFAEYLLPNFEIYTDVRRPYESLDGIVTSVCHSPGANRRFIIQMAQGKWSLEEVMTERPQQAWRSWDDSLWAFTFNSVLRLDLTNGSTIEKEPTPGALFDVAVETNGVFWVASSEGLVRYAPFLWRPPKPFEELNVPVQAICFDRENLDQAWVASSEGLHHLRDNRAALLYRWPEDLEGIQPGGKMFYLPDGTLILAAGPGLLLFNPDKKEMGRVDLGPAQGTLLGQFKDGAAAIRISGTNDLASVRKYSAGALVEFLPEPLPKELLEATVFLETSNGDFWFGGPHGMTVLRAATQEYEHFGLQDGLIPERILCLGEAGENRVWAGTMDRVFELRGKRWESVLMSVDRVFAIQHAGEDNAWVSTASGIFRRVRESWIYHGTSEGLPGQSVYTLAQDSRNRIWAGTSRGVAVYHADADTDPPKTGQPQVLQPQKPSTTEPVLISFQGADKWNYTDAGELLYAYRLDEGAWSAFLPQTVRSFPQLTSGDHRLGVRAMDKNGNIDPNLAMIEFTVIVPWFRDPRLIGVSVLGMVIILFFAALAVNRHLQLKRSYARVGQIVDQRTRELEIANQELLHSQKMKAIGTMAAGIAHDFNNILSIIKGSAQIIEEHPHDEQKIKTRVDRIQTVVEQGTSIVNALLGLGRLNENQLTLCDGGSLLEETGRLLADRFSEKVELEIIAEPNLPRLKCSREVVQQMLINLLLNAVDAMGGKGRVTLRAERVARGDLHFVLEPAEAGDYLQLSVEDRGSGIAPQNLPRIFEPFFTTKAFSSRRGTGLGLSMVYELAKAMGYGLAVQSTPNEGSVFSIIIPMEAAGAVDA